MTLPGKRGTSMRGFHPSVQWDRGCIKTSVEDGASSLTEINVQRYASKASDSFDDLEAATPATISPLYSSTFL